MRRLARWLPLLLLLLGGLSGCMRLSEGVPPGPWHAAYEPIDDPESDAFVIQALEMAVAEYGEPVVPVKKVLLRRSKKVDAARRYRLAEDFSLTECADASNGLFVIYLAVDPGHEDYFPLLAHECAHLLNPYIFDWYMEGFATLFSERACAETGREWGDWRRRFAKSRRKPYALSYRMMRELQREFPAEYPSIIHFTAANGRGSGRLHIDIDAWLQTLPAPRRAAALAIISPYTKVLHRNSSAQYHFAIPQEEPPK
jgi:hypothetical protein